LVVGLANPGGSRKKSSYGESGESMKLHPEFILKTGMRLRG
jgi:hypothetical protein